MVHLPEQRHLSYCVSSNGYRGVLVTRSRGSQPTDETTCSCGRSSCHHKHAGEDRVNILMNHRSRWYDLQTICLPALNYVTDWTVVYIGSTPLYGWSYIGGSDGNVIICQSLNYAIGQVVTATDLLMVQYTWKMWWQKIGTHWTMSSAK